MKGVPAHWAGFSRLVNSNSGTYVLNVGGNWNANDNYGLFYFNANYDALYASAYIGSRLIYHP